MRSSTACDRLDIQRAAHSMIANHGSHAIRLAAERARNLEGADADDARETWERVAREIVEIEKRKSRRRAEMH